MIKYARIKGYPDYSVSNTGLIISHKFGKYKVLKACVDNRGYLAVKLCGKQRRTYRIHTIVVEAFIGEIKGNTVNHNDGNKLNNNINNLEILSESDNMEHAFITGLHTHPRVAVKQLSMSGKIVNIFRSLMDAERVTGINNSLISRVINGKRNSTGGYLWERVRV